MLGINYLKELPQKIREWRRFKTAKFHKSVFETGKIPSETYIKYPPLCDFGGNKVLNVGCGTSTYSSPNVVNLDAVQGKGVNVVHDLAKLPLPFPDNHFDHIVANHVLEHIPNWFELFKELSRICKVGGILEIWVPPVSADSAFTYRDHINPIGILSFAGTASFRNPGCNLVVGAENKLLDHAARMSMIRHAKRPYMKWWLHFASDSLLNWFTTHLRNVVSEEQFLFRKVDHVG